MVRRHMSIQVEAVKQRLLRHRSLTHHRPTLRMLAMSESVDRRYFKTEFFNTIRRKAASHFVAHLRPALAGSRPGALRLGFSEADLQARRAYRPDLTLSGPSEVQRQSADLGQTKTLAGQRLLARRCAN